MPGPLAVTESRVGAIFDPTALKSSEPYSGYGTAFPSFDAHAEKVEPPRLMTEDGRYRAVADWGRELSRDKTTAVRQVAAALWHGKDAPYRYLPYGTLDKARPTVNAGLKRGGGECDWFAAVGYQALLASRAFKRDDLWMGQVYANGGWHNVVFFKNQSGTWDVLDYQKVVSVDARTPAEAMRSYFGNHERGELYRADDPDQRAEIGSKVRSDHQATLAGFLSQPGIDGGMSPSFGSTAGLNEGLSGALLPRDSGLGTSGSGLRVSAGGFTVDGRLGPEGLDRAGFSFLTAPSDGKVAGIKGLVVRDTSGEGINLLAAGEWWNIQPNSYLGVVVGAEARLGIGTQRMKDEGTLTTVAPIAAVQGGFSGDISGNASSPARWGWFTNGRAQLAAPLVVNQAGQERIDKNSNGLSLGGVLDPGFLGNVEVGANAGLSARYAISPVLSVSGTATARVELQDFTLNGWPVAVGGQLEARLSYRGRSADAELGAAGGYGVYDRDVLWRVYVGAGSDVSRSIALSAQVGAGQFMSREGFAHVQVGVKTRLGPVTLSGSAGLSAVTAPDQPAQLVPALGLQGSF